MTQEGTMKRREKRQKESERSQWNNNNTNTIPLEAPLTAPRGKRKSKALQKHGNDAPSGGVEALLPSFLGLVILACGVMAKMGFRGRASVAGIDLGTTNSVICVQVPAKGVGEIECIVDPASGSPILPSVVSFLEPSERKIGPSSKIPSLLDPHPTHVVVGQSAKRRIDSHPHHTLYNAKRMLGRSANDPSVQNFGHEVDFVVDRHESDDSVVFRVPDTPRAILPQQVGSYVVHHLMQVANLYLGHDNVKSAVICVPAKFDALQRRLTMQAFQQAGMAVARVVEEPTAAALAYGLHRKEGVDYILVYDFGGGTLDVSLLHVSDGFVDVMGSDGDDRLGGADFDAAVAHFLLEDRKGQAIVDQVALFLHTIEESMPGVDMEEALSAKCPALSQTPLCTTSSFHTIGEQLKIELSAYPDGGGVVNANCLGFGASEMEQPMSLEAFCDGLEASKLTLMSDEYSLLSRPLFDRSVLPIDRLLKDLGISDNEIDEVVMVGGTTRMPQIRRLVQQALPSSQLNTHIDPDLTVAYGAASVID